MITDAGWSVSQAVFTASIYQLGGLLGGFVASSVVDRSDITALAVAMLLAGIATAITDPVTTPLELSLAAAFTRRFPRDRRPTYAECLHRQPALSTDRRATGLGWALGSVRLGGILAGSLGAGFMLGLELPVWNTFLIVAVPKVVGRGPPHQLSSGLFRMKYIARGIVGGSTCEHDTSDAEQAISDYA